jgi:hypothetical protein
MITTHLTLIKLDRDQKKVRMSFMKNNMLKNKKGKCKLYNLISFITKNFLKN